MGIAVNVDDRSAWLQLKSPSAQRLSLITTPSLSLDALRLWVQNNQIVNFLTCQVRRHQSQ